MCSLEGLYNLRFSSIIRNPNLPFAICQNYELYVDTDSGFLLKLDI